MISDTIIPPVSSAPFILLLFFFLPLLSGSTPSLMIAPSSRPSPTLTGSSATLSRRRCGARPRSAPSTFSVLPLSLVYFCPFYDYDSLIISPSMFLFIWPTLFPPLIFFQVLVPSGLLESVSTRVILSMTSSSPNFVLFSLTPLRTVYGELRKVGDMAQKERLRFQSLSTYS